MTSTITITRRPITLPSGFSFHLVEVAGGSFMMGNDDEDAYGDEKIIHEVKVPGFWMAEHPTTQALWLDLMGGENPSYFQGARRPVERVSWYDAAAFCNALNALFGYQAKYFVDKKCSQALDIERARSVEYPDSIAIYVASSHFGFRLPSEAEWEYAASAPLSDRASAPLRQWRYAGSNTLDEVGWYDQNSHGQTQPVGLKMPNELGLYDLSGNVWEWCEDQWHGSYEGAPLDGSPWVDQESGAYRVLRGGSWFINARYCRPSYRFNHPPAYRLNAFGFRVVLFPPPGSWPGI
ncbi:formylglycine-generating enzyme family protein [Haliscomenobacter hydrossis]|uniref:Sulphatase-modifying factor protein n=1 Tax=Haliscomenobacter hydrossis (strain ATCC 27775 / DSM 1100 / LMG 10767 / O) TaxID=760192 RepID=F4L790_HALH1|nr:formylglycine-generating enzyme family protein [Haliscomenobacter hydrossis]AEE53117.1 Sulphatase-modifying factor protein [Haliscomenobacter hydrossis DSM 1100]